MKSEKTKKFEKKKKTKLAVILSLTVLTACLMTACGSDEIDEYRDDTANTMNNATGYVDSARDVVNDTNEASSQYLDDIE